MGKQIKITISERCEKAWEYLRKHRIKPGPILCSGGEMAVINKANEFYHKEKRIKYAPDWVYE